MTEALDLTVLVLPRDGGFFAQAIEHAFSATGRTRQEALENLCAVLQGQASLDRDAGRAPLTWAGPARAELRDLAARIRTDLPARVVDLFPEETAPSERPTRLRLAAVG